MKEGDRRGKSERLEDDHEKGKDEEEERKCAEMTKRGGSVRRREVTGCRGVHFSIGVPGIMAIFCAIKIF